MKTSAEINVELIKVRSLLAQVRRVDEYQEGRDMLYGAQQALIWMLGIGDSPSQLWDIIMALAEEMASDG